MPETIVLKGVRFTAIPVKHCVSTQLPLEVAIAKRRRSRSRQCGLRVVSDRFPRLQPNPKVRACLLLHPTHRSGAGVQGTQRRSRLRLVYHQTDERIDSCCSSSSFACRHGLRPGSRSRKPPSQSRVVPTFKSRFSHIKVLACHNRSNRRSRASH
jgi:hypothetical protein